MQMYILTGVRNNDIILLDGHIYIKHYLYQNNTLKWKCDTKNCNAHIITPSIYNNLDFNVEVVGTHIEGDDGGQPFIKSC